jgi:hypothetical protein
MVLVMAVILMVLGTDADFRSPIVVLIVLVVDGSGLATHHLI